MPIDYRIDPERRLILTHAWGVLTDADLLAHKERLLGDPALDPSLPELSDIRGIDRLDVTQAGVAAMVRHDAVHAARRPGHRMALVVPTGVTYGMARMYQSMGQGEEGVGVFRTLEEAEAWLAQGQS